MCLLLREILTESYALRIVRSTCERHFKIVIPLAAETVLFLSGSLGSHRGSAWHGEYVLPFYRLGP